MSGGVKGAVWTDRGIIYSPAAKAGLFRVGEDGGAPEALTVPDASKGEVSHRWPAALPDGRHLLFTIKKEGITSFDQAEIAVLDLEAKSWTTIIRGGSFGRYLATGHIAYVRGGSIVAVPYDVRSSKVTGPAFTVLSNVMTEPGSGAAQFAIAADAGCARVRPRWAEHPSTRSWSGFDRHGTFTPVGAPLAPYYDPRLAGWESHRSDVVRRDRHGRRVRHHPRLVGASEVGREYDADLVASRRASASGVLRPGRRRTTAVSGRRRRHGAMRRVPLDIPGLEARLLVEKSQTVSGSFIDSRAACIPPASTARPRVSVSRVPPRRT